MFGLGAKIPQISPQELESELKRDALLVVIDVRTTPEFRAGHIPGSKLIPLQELNRRLHEIPKDRRVVTVCHSGSRSRMAARQLLREGYDVYNMAGGMVRWSGRTVR
jgi:rhodanese-related sulfurtransferase